jgi:hypothetical protein
MDEAVALPPPLCDNGGRNDYDNAKKWCTRLISAHSSPKHPHHLSVRYASVDFRLIRGRFGCGKAEYRKLELLLLDWSLDFANPPNSHHQGSNSPDWFFLNTSTSSKHLSDTGGSLITYSVLRFW